MTKAHSFHDALGSGVSSNVKLRVQFCFGYLHRFQTDMHSINQKGFSVGKRGNIYLINQMFLLSKIMN